MILRGMIFHGVEMAADDRAPRDLAGTQSAAVEQRDVYAAVLVSLFEVDAIGFVKQGGVENDRAVSAIGDLDGS